MKTRFQPGKSRPNPSKAVPDVSVQGDLALGSDIPLIEAVISAPPSVVAGDCQSVLSMPADASGTSNVVVDAGCESGVLPRASVPPEIMETGLGPNLTAASLLSVSESSENSVDAESDTEVGIPRVASCPALLQVCNQQIDQPSVPSAGCNSAGITSHAPPAESLSHLSPSSPDDQACLDAASLLLASASASVCCSPVVQALISLLSWSLFLLGHAAGFFVLRFLGCMEAADGDFEFLSRFLPGVEGAVLWSCWSFPGVTSVMPGSVLLHYQGNANQMRFLLPGYWPVAILSWAAVCGWSCPCMPHYNCYSTSMLCFCCHFGLLKQECSGLRWWAPYCCLTAGYMPCLVVVLLVGVC
ncbi:hypothetical protein Nepgr_014711 [Nepenthes gracilis]|uniref:Uncharacterized protein n=1 Tax=Nepenthes gracilis TaxID=150966 RepID=A0AAD3XQR6_NEPGR|nr:hypothetical protein Nepgr_014711 [Nepenthes gracilis]